MSPLWRDEVGIYLSPRRVALTRMKRGIRPMNIAEHDSIVESGDSNQWEGAIETLDACLEDAAWHGAAARLIIANHWARYAIVPWSDALTDHDERIQHARYCLGKIYGEVVSQWTVTRNEAPPGSPQVACAIPSSLLGAIQSSTERCGLRVKSVQPQLITAFNSWRAKLPKGTGWFVTLEEGSLAAAHFTAAGWNGVRSVRIGNDWAVELKRLQTFARLARSNAEEGIVYVDAPQWLRTQVDASELGFEWLDDGSDSSAAANRFPLLQRIYA